MSSERLLYSAVRAARGTLQADGIALAYQQEFEQHLPSCVGCIPPNGTHKPGQNYVSYEDILWCDTVDERDLAVEIAYMSADKSPRVTREIVEITSQSGKDLASSIMESAYAQSKPGQSVLILLNNHGGQGKALKIYRTQILPVLTAAHVKVTYMETRHSKHAVEVGREMDISKFDIVACCSGDGVPHEVINGMYERADRAEAFTKIAVTQLPCGLGNAMSLSTHGTNDAGLAALRMLKLVRCKMDLMAVTQAGGTQLSFLSQAYGIIADCDIGTEHLRWMGPLRFDLGVAQRVFAKAAYPCDLYVLYGTKHKDEIREHIARHRATSTGGTTRAVSEEDLTPRFPDVAAAPPPDWERLPDTDNLNILYVGNMPYVLADTQFFPAALPDDGHMDLVVATTKTLFFQMAKVLLSVGGGGHVDLSHIHHAKIVAYRLVPRMADARNHYISVDGESFPFEPLQTEVMPGVLTVLLRNGAYVDTSMSAQSPSRFDEVRQ